MPTYVYFVPSLVTIVVGRIGMPHARLARKTTPPKPDETVTDGRLASTPQGTYECFSFISHSLIECDACKIGVLGRRLGLIIPCMHEAEGKTIVSPLVWFVLAKNHNISLF